MLFNCAALASQIATEQNIDNDECLKAAAKYYQVCLDLCSSICFLYVVLYFWKLILKYIRVKKYC